MEMSTTYSSTKCYISTFHAFIWIDMFGLFKKKSKRPLIKDVKTEKKMIEFVSKHMLERINYYNMAKFHVTYDLNDKMDACKKIIGILNKNGL